MGGFRRFIANQWTWIVLIFLLGSFIALMFVYFLGCPSSISLGFVAFPVPGCSKTVVIETEVTRIVEATINQMTPQPEAIAVNEQVTQETIEVTRPVTVTVEVTRQSTSVVLGPIEVTRLVTITTTPELTQSLNTDLSAATEVTVVVTATPTPEPSALPNVLYEENFDRGTANGWSPITSNDWRVEETNGQFEYLCAREARTDYINQDWTDYIVSVNVRSISSNVDVGVIGRKDGERYYLAQLINGQAKILRRQTNGQWVVIQNVGYATSQGVVYNIALEIDGINLTMYINGEKIGNTVQDTVIPSGTIGLRCGGNAVQAAFDEVLVLSR